MEDVFNEIKDKMDAFAKDAILQIEKSNKTAGMRARKASLEVEKLLKEFRKQSLDYSK